MLTHAGTTPVSTTNSFCGRKALWFIQKLFAILSPFVMVVAGSFLLSSCSAEALISSLRGNEIQFEVTENPIVLDSGATSTRATMVTSLSQIKVYAYDASGNTVINGAIYTNNNGTWTSSTSTEWPSGTVTFYAFSPANNSSVSFNTSTKQLTYTAPTAQDSQQDVCYAYTSTTRPANNTVALTFNHANAAFSVNARLASGCTATVSVSGVSIVNVKPTNTLTFNNSAVSASGSNITSALKCSTRSLTTTDQAISTEPLMLPPQTVTAWAGNNAISSQTGAYLAVNCKVAQDDKYVVGSATADGTVYVPMSKPLNRGENNSVNLVFGNEENGARCYGRDANGNRITYSTSTSDNPFSFITSADVGKFIYLDKNQKLQLISNEKTISNDVYDYVYAYNGMTNKLDSLTAMEYGYIGLIAYVSSPGHGLIIPSCGKNNLLGEYRTNSTNPTPPYYNPNSPGFGRNLNIALMTVTSEIRSLASESKSKSKIMENIYNTLEPKLPFVSDMNKIFKAFGCTVEDFTWEKYNG